MGDDIEVYIATTKMDQMGSYGTDNEMLTLSHLLLCNVYSFNAMALNWSYLADPRQIDPNIPLKENQCIFTGEMDIILML